MTTKPRHLGRLIDTGARLRTADGEKVRLWKLEPDQDPVALKEWAKHFGAHLYSREVIEQIRGRSTVREVLERVLPHRSKPPRPSLRAGTFGEILVADYVEWMLRGEVPRVRWLTKGYKHQSPGGYDVVGFRFQHENRKSSKMDTLMMFEVKAKLSNSKLVPLQNAINQSVKDYARIGESLTALQIALCEAQQLDLLPEVERYQNYSDDEYKFVCGAAAVISDEYYNSSEITGAKAAGTEKPKHSCNDEDIPRSIEQHLIVITGDQLMDLVHELYRRVIDEA